MARRHWVRRRPAGWSSRFRLAQDACLCLVRYGRVRAAREAEAQLQIPSPRDTTIHRASIPCVPLRDKTHASTRFIRPPRRAGRHGHKAAPEKLAVHPDPQNPCRAGSGRVPVDPGGCVKWSVPQSQGLFCARLVPANHRGARLAFRAKFASPQIFCRPLHWAGYPAAR